MLVRSSRFCLYSGRMKARPVPLSMRARYSLEWRSTDELRSLPGWGRSLNREKWSAGKNGSTDDRPAGLVSAERASGSHSLDAVREREREDTVL